MAHMPPTTRQKERGQSLVETALLLPMLLLIIAGLVEISNLVVAQSRTDTAARIGARFGANGGEPAGIRIASLNALTQTLELDEELWDMWVFEGSLNITGTAFAVNSWNWEHVYGMGQTNRFTDTSEVSVQQQVLNNLRSQGDQNASELKVVGVLIYHDMQTILGLENYLQGLNTVRGFAVMEVAPVVDATQLNGCTAFPMILEYGQRSINEIFYNNIPLQEWDYPNGNDRPEFSTFKNHEVDVPLEQAVEGSVYYFESQNGGSNVYVLGGANTNFDWVAWNTVDPDTTNNLQEMQASLPWPGNSGSADPALAYVDPVTFIRDGMHAINPADPTTYDLVSKTSFNTNSGDIKSEMEEHVDRGRALRFIVYERDMVGGATHPVDLPYVPEGAYKIRGFVIARLIGYQLRGHTHWLMLEVIRWDDSCGQRAP